MSTRTRERSAPAGRPSAVRSNAPDTPQGSSHRTPIEARIAERATIERALEARLTGSELRVLLALMVKVTKFDRLEDRVANIELVRLTGIASRHVREAVAGLAEKGVIEREPGGGRSASLYDREGQDA